MTATTITLCREAPRREFPCREFPMQSIGAHLGTGEVRIRIQRTPAVRMCR